MTCHNSMRAMPRDVPAKAIEPHPYWGAQGRRVGDIRKSLLISRTAQDDAGAWDKVKPPTDLDKLKSSGKFLDLWQWRAARSNGAIFDDTVSNRRHYVTLPLTLGLGTKGDVTALKPGHYFVLTII